MKWDELRRARVNGVCTQQQEGGVDTQSFVEKDKRVYEREFATGVNYDLISQGAVT